MVAILATKDAAYRMQRYPRAKMMAIELNRLALYLGITRDEQPSGGISVTCVGLGRGKSAPSSLSGNAEAPPPPPLARSLRSIFEPKIVLNF
jgi:hypothetical protein